MRNTQVVSSLFFCIQMCPIALFLSVDPNLGRVDYSSLSDQTLMEMLFDGFDDEAKKEYQDNEGMYLDVCDWSCVTCDDDERVIKIGADSSDISGSIQLCYVPPKVKKLKVTPSWPGSKLTGSVDLAHLPKDMKHLDLQKNIFTGEIELTKLPEKMKKLILDHNILTGEIDLTQLPKGMRSLSLRNNQFAGAVDLTRLPEEMRWLALNNNRLTGAIDLTQLPHAIGALYLNDNQLIGEIDLSQLPVAMICLNLSSNHLSGSIIINELLEYLDLDLRENLFNSVAVVDTISDAAIKLEESGVMAVVDESGIEVDMTRFLK